MKQLNIYFEDAEYEDLVKLKKSKKATWHDLIMKLTDKKVREAIGETNARKS